MSNDTKLPHIIQPNVMGNYSATTIPILAKYNVSDKIWDSTPVSGDPMGWICINRQDTEMRVQAVATDTTIEVDATTGMLSGDSITFVLDDDSVHHSIIASITDGDTLVIDDVIPSGRTADVDADVFTNRWNDMSNLA
jgi:hypothetical protein